jgi:hypothetical protein
MTGAINTPALNNAIVALLAAGGGTLSIPAGTYFIDAPISIEPALTGPPAGIIVAGVSGQTRLIQKSAADIFDVTSMNAYEGVRFRDLYLSYAPFNPGSSIYVAVNVQNSSSVSCECVYFSDCPTAFQTDGKSPGCGLFNCLIYYDLRTSADEDAPPVDNQTMISLGSTQGFVTNCVILQQYVNAAHGGPTGCTGIYVGGDNDGRYISDLHISAFAYGIRIDQGLNDVFCTDLRIDAYQNAVVIMPANDNGTIYNVHFSNCTFANAIYGNTLMNPPTSGVVINTNGGANSNVSGIYFANCAAYGWANAGIEIDSGENIVITGGQYSSNGQNPSETYLGAGIAVSSAAQGADQVTISGVDCSGISQYWQTNGEGTVVAQPYGIAVSGLVSDVTITGCHLVYNGTGAVLVTLVGSAVPTNVYIRDCNARGYSSYNVAMNVASSAPDIQITNCAGYNDQGKVFTSAVASGSTFHPYTFGYWGPVECYIANGAATIISSITVDGTVIPLKSGSVLLVPGESASIAWTPTILPIGFVVIGK